ncbi:hypothetical protein MRX96_050369 [Rhipicephalus microplus]
MASPSISRNTEDICVVVVSAKVSFSVAVSILSVPLSTSVAGVAENTITDGTVTENIMVSSVLFSEDTDEVGAVSFISHTVTGVSLDGTGTVVNMPASVVTWRSVVIPEAVVCSSTTAAVVCAVVTGVVTAFIIILTVALATSLLSVAKVATVV